MLRLPHELLPAMPPSVACALVDTSTGYHRPWAFSAAFRWSSTMPGSTSTVRLATSTRQDPAHMLAEVDHQALRPLVWPHWLVPPPAGTMGTPRSRQMSSASATSSYARGTNTPTGKTW
jgi:hypothetical protein